MNDSKTMFTGKADIYAKVRPAYAEEAIEHLQKIGLKAGASVADVGSGTGKFSKHLLEIGAAVYAVEPNEDMRGKAEEELGKYPNFHSINAGAENTSLSDNSVDFVTAAQAFHWFDPLMFKKECRRILKPGGKAVLAWNNAHTPDDPRFQEYVRESTELEQKYYPDLDRPRSQNKTLDSIEAFFTSYEKTSFENPFYYDRETFVLGCLSASFALRPSDALYGEYVRELGELFDKYQTEGRLLSPTRTDLFIGGV